MRAAGFVGSILSGLKLYICDCGADTSVCSFRYGSEHELVIRLMAIRGEKTFWIQVIGFSLTETFC